MTRHARQLAESRIYHVMLRGVNRDAILLEDEDHDQFLHCLALVKEASGCRVLAYCLMTNHVHLVLRTTDEPISLVIKRLGVRYAGWFNRKYGRVGHLFQDRFASHPVEDDAYLVTLLRYVWNNPVEAGLCDRPEEYHWSSRRLLGRPSSLLDEADLVSLVDLSALVERAGAPPALAERTVRRGRPRRHTDHQAAQLLRRASGASGPDDFRMLDAAAQVRTIRELRTRGVAYDQIAKITGLSATAVRRRHASGTR